MARGWDGIIYISRCGRKYDAPRWSRHSCRAQVLFSDLDPMPSRNLKLFEPATRVNPSVKNSLKNKPSPTFFPESLIYLGIVSTNFVF